MTSGGRGGPLCAFHRHARDVNLRDGAIVAEDLHKKKLLREALDPLGGERHRGGRARIQRDEIGLGADAERADPIGDAERRRIAERRSMER